jgi:hypothetical protein
MKVTATGRGIPFFRKLRIRGTMAHSHTGKQIPNTLARPMARNLFFGNIRAINSRDTKRVTSDDKREPKRRKGAASRKRAMKVLEN